MASESLFHLPGPMVLCPLAFVPSQMAAKDSLRSARVQHMLISRAKPLLLERQGHLLSKFSCEPSMFTVKVTGAAHFAMSLEGQGIATAV